MRREQVERCLSTTMTIKDWCALNGVAESTMYAWMARFRKEEPELFGAGNASEWIEVTREAISARTALATVDGPSHAAAVPAAAGGMPQERASDAPAVTVRVNGAEVVVPEGVGQGHLASVLRAVASL